MKKYRRYHVGLDIESYLAKSDEELEAVAMDMYANPTRRLRGHELRAILEKAASEGKTCFVGCDHEKPDGSCAGHEVEYDATQILPPGDIEAMRKTRDQEHAVSEQMMHLLEDSDGWDSIVDMLGCGARRCEMIQDELMRSMTENGSVPRELVKSRLINGLAWSALADLVLARQKQLDEQKAKDGKDEASK